MTTDDLVERLRAEGKDAFARQYSLGMFKLCAEAADEIERLREAAKGAAVIASTSGSLLKEKDAEIERLRSELGKAKSVSDEMVAVAYNRFINATTETEECERCKGVGYHHGFGERGHDPDWCEGCGGPGIQPKYDEKTAMRLALESALAGGQG